MYAKRLLWPIVTVIFPLLFTQTALAAVGTSSGYILDSADTTNGGHAGTSATYGLEGISGDSFGGRSSSASYNLCAGFMEEIFGSCAAAPPPPPP
ncbi:hypothetical protein KJ835_00855, partial [Patescibacteria group bacterium]|nr:hypothetical protein [Patescibacteria group bacterium]